MQTRLRKLKGIIARLRNGITRILIINSGTTVLGNRPLLLPREVLVHTRQPRIDRVAEEILADVMDVVGPFLYLVVVVSRLN